MIMAASSALVRDAPLPDEHAVSAVSSSAAARITDIDLFIFFNSFRMISLSKGSISIY